MDRKTCCRLFVGFWMLCFGTVVWARTFLDIVHEFDYASAGVALAVAMMSSFIRTTVTLANEKAVVMQELRQSWRDLVFALAAGGVAYLLTEIIVAVWWRGMPDIVRYAVVLFAGAQRLEFLGKANRFVDRISDAAADRAVAVVNGGDEKDGRVETP